MQVAGDIEKIRDEAIYFAHRASETNKYKGPSYNADKFEKSPFQTPTNVILEIYEEMIHVFQVNQYQIDFFLKRIISYTLIFFILSIMVIDEMPRIIYQFIYYQLFKKKVQLTTKIIDYLVNYFS